jgi:hypothetical protein
MNAGLCAIEDMTLGLIRTYSAADPAARVRRYTASPGEKSLKFLPTAEITPA